MNRILTLHGPSGGLRWRWPEWTAIFVFEAAVASAFPCREPWTDEAQAWQLTLPLAPRANSDLHLR